MRKIALIGSPGSGKSTLSKKLAERLGLPLVHLDNLYWKKDWVPTPQDQWEQQLKTLVQQEEWVIDGNYNRTLDIRIQAADTVILLNLPRLVCIRRVLGRHGRKRSDLNGELKERWNVDFIKFLWFIWKFPNVSLPKIMNKLNGNAGHKRIVILTTPAEVEAFLEGVTSRS